MPLSSKKIIENIRTFKGTFTRKEVLNRLVDPKIEKNKNKAKKSRKKPYRFEKDVAAIDNTLQALISYGFLVKKKNLYAKARPFSLEGRIAVNTSGSAIVHALDDEIIIKSGNIGHAHTNDQVSVDIIDIKKGRLIGIVKNIVDRTKSVFTARVVKKTSGTITYELIDMPGDSELCSERFNGEPDIGDSVIVKIEEGLKSGKPRCSVIDRFSLENEEFDLKRIIHKYNLPEEYPPIQGLDTIENSVSSFEMSNRKDFTSQLTVTIDGEDAKDFDDAVSVTISEDRYILFVHIADVSAYVVKNSPLDREALLRGTSYYLGNHVIPMLPEKLSNELCSLRAGEESLTLSAEMHFDKDGNCVEHYFYRGTINVSRRLTYTEAHQILQGGDHDLFKVLSDMRDLADVLRKKRMREGSLDLNLDEEKLIYTDNKITGITVAERLVSHSIVEEFMLQANIIVSKTLKKHKVPALYRIHESMSDESYYDLKNFLKQLNIPLKKSTSRWSSLQEVLRFAEDRDYRFVVNLAVLKSLTQAYYGIDPIGHFGLAFEDYTHFTSPIRRYPDLIVHRCLKSVIDRSEHPYPAEELIFIGEKSSELERIAQKAERDLVKIKICRLMMDRIGETFNAVVSGVSKIGFYVSLKELPVEGMVPLRNLTDDYYLVMEDDYTVVGRKLGRRFRLGDALEVRLVKVELERMIIDFDVI